ncbi:MAG: ATP-binding protein [Myxococcota bacterium]
MSVLSGITLVVLYLVALIGISAWADRGGVVARLGEHPLSLGLALGVYATSFTLFGGVGYADEHGYAILGFYLGVVLSCIAVPLLWWPLAEVVRTQRLTSLADLLAFRFTSPWIGPVVTLVLLTGLLPYLSLQMRALEAAAVVLHGKDTSAGPLYAAVLGLFAALLGVRYAEPWARRPGLLTTLVVESGVKVVTTGVVGLAALYGAFGGFSGFGAHFEAHPEAARALLDPIEEPLFANLVVLSFFGAFLLPRQFHVAFATQAPRAAWRHVIWLLPVLLLGFLLPVPVLLEAGRAANVGGTPDLFVLTWTEDPALRMVGFLGGVSGSSAMVLVTTLALSGMVVTHLALPLRVPGAVSRTSVRRTRQVVMVTLVVLGLVADAFLSQVVRLVDLGLVSFAVVAQFAPGVLCTLFWRRATSAGFLAGLAVGLAGVAALMGWPLLNGLPPGQATDGLIECLLVNVLVLMGVSLITTPRPDEQRAFVTARRRWGLGPPPVSLRALEERVARQLGPELAKSEVDRARRTAGVAPMETRPDRLRSVVQVVERQLSGLVGPLLARAATQAPNDGDDVLIDLQLRVIEEYGEEQDQVRDWLRGLLRDLPDGVVVTSRGGEVRLWNPTAQAITGFGPEEVVGARLDQLPHPLPALLTDAGEHVVRLPVGQRTLVVRTRTLSHGTRIVLLTDITEQRALQVEVDHRVRLASVGRMAAGVAHEIRNPLMGILMLAGNLRREVAEDDHAERLNALIHEGHRIEAIVRTLLEHSRSSQRPRGPVTVRSIVDEALLLAKFVPQLREHAVEVDIHDATVWGTLGSLTQVLVNLLTNAAQASPKGRPIEIRARTQVDDVVIEVLDEGSGIDESVAETLFEPFVTTKPVSEGTGLGLAVCWRIVLSHDGTLTTKRVAGRTCFALTLPQVEVGSEG